MFQQQFYHKTIRKIVSAFGTMFNNVWLVKYDSDGNETERIKVPLSFAQKEKFIMALYADPSQDKPTQISLPRMSFEFKSMAYDPLRKLPSINRVYTAHPSDKDKLYQNFTPTPYNFAFDVNIYTRNIEDLSQIIEQIVPYFTPDYTVTVALVDANGQRINKDIPITLDSIIHNIEYEGDSITPRYVTALLSFTLQGYLYGPTTNSAIIRKAITNIYDTLADDTQYSIVMVPGGSESFHMEEEVYSGEDWVNANWRARVVNWNPITRKLILYQVKGKRVPEQGDVVYGIDSGAIWITESPAHYLTVPISTDFDCAESPNSTANSVVGNLVIEGRIEMPAANTTDFGPNFAQGTWTEIVNKATGTAVPFSWCWFVEMTQEKKLVCSVYENPTSLTSNVKFGFSNTLPFPVGDRFDFRVSYTAANGAIRFSSRPDSTHVWTGQGNVPGNGNAMSIGASNDPIRVGSWNSQNAETALFNVNYVRPIFWIKVYNGSNLIAHFNPQIAPTGKNLMFLGGVGETWTLRANAEIKASSGAVVGEIGEIMQSPLKMAKIVTEPSPNTANVNDANVSYTHVITEFPNIED